MATKTKPFLAMLIGVGLLAAACSNQSGHAGATKKPRPRPPVTSVPTSSKTTTSTSTTAVPTTITAPPDTATIGVLVTRSQPQGNYTVSLPASWVFADTSVPSDHATNTWTSPTDPNAVLTVVLSGCSGCVVASPGSTTPDPGLILPAGATLTRTVAPNQIFYTNTSSVAGYTDFGTVIVTSNSSGITGYVKLDVVLTSSQSSSADAILTSFALSS